MNPIFLGLGAGLLITILGGGAAIVLGVKTRNFTLSSVLIDLSCAAGNLVMSLTWLLRSDVPYFSVVNAGIAGYYAWCAWKTWRNRKDRKPSRVLGVVKDLGHRLTVAPVPGGAR